MIEAITKHGGLQIIVGVAGLAILIALWDCYKVWRSPEFKADCARLKAQRAARLRALRDEPRRFLEPWEVVLFIIALVSCVLMFWPPR